MHFQRQGCYHQNIRSVKKVVLLPFFLILVNMKYLKDINLLANRKDISFIYRAFLDFSRKIILEKMISRYLN